MSPAEWPSCRMNGRLCVCKASGKRFDFHLQPLMWLDTWRRFIQQIFLRLLRFFLLDETNDRCGHLVNRQTNEKKGKKNKFSGRPPVSDAGAALGERFHLDLGEKRRVGGADFIFITHFSFAQFRSSFSSFFSSPQNLFPVGEAEKMQRRRWWWWGGRLSTNHTRRRGNCVFLNRS